MKSKRIIRSPLCSYQTHCGAKAILGAITPWDDGQGYSQPIYCCRCPAVGHRSCNTGPDTSKARAKAKADRVDGILIVPPLKVKRT